MNLLASARKATDEDFRLQVKVALYQVAYAVEHDEQRKEVASALLTNVDASVEEYVWFVVSQPDFDPTSVNDTRLVDLVSRFVNRKAGIETSSSIIVLAPGSEPEPRPKATFNEGMGKRREVFALRGMDRPEGRFERGMALMLPLWEADELEAQGLVSSTKPLTQDDGRDPTIRVVEHTANEWKDRHVVEVKDMAHGGGVIDATRPRQ